MRDVVVRIFRERLEGKSLAQIARELNADGIMAPSVYWQSIGVIHKQKYTNLWEGKQVRRILENVVYTGDVEISKTYRAYYRGITKSVSRDKGERFYVEGHHEAIIDHETFDRVQELMRKAKAGYDAVQRNLGGERNKREDKLQGLLYCGHCGNKMNLYRKTVKLVDGYGHYSTYVCRRSSTYGEVDPPKNIKADAMEGIVMELLKAHIVVYVDSASVSDVLVFHRAGTVISYYVEKNGFTVIEDFIKSENSSSGAAVSIETTNFQIKGKVGKWLAFDSIRLEGQDFFLMEHETYGKEAVWVVVDGAGKLIVDHVRNGFDQEVKAKLEEYLHPSQPEEGRQEKIQQQPDPAEQENPLPYREENSPDKPRLDNWQKYMENGEYLRSAEISEEQNYNMIDGRKNNGYKVPPDRTGMPSPKKPQGRQSVLAKLHKKQAEIAQRNGQKERQQSAENDMERERK